MLSEIEIKAEYRTPKDNVVRDFFIPLLSVATMYKRAVGFFSSTALIQIARGISGLVENGGRIMLIASPRLPEEDIEAINSGYKKRNEVIENALLREFKDHNNNYFESERLNLLATLIAEGRLDIKIAFTENNNQIGIYHEKMGLILDSNSNTVAFSGSINESKTAFLLNYEVMDVFCSWKTDFEKNKIKEKVSAFERMWLNEEDNIEIIEFPEIVKEKLQSYKREIVDYTIDEKEIVEYVYDADIEFLEILNLPRIPNDFKFHDYQIDAIKQWSMNNYIGIYDMATGTGKTYTALGSIVELTNNCKGELAVIITCPYQHLVEQWVDDLNLFNIIPIIGYSASPQKDWKKKLNDAVLDQKLGVEGKHFFCFICTNATFSSLVVQQQLLKIKGNVLLIVDEAHNFGAASLSNLLIDKYNFRLALSATLERHNDEEGTGKLFNFFGNKCIEYPLEKAIIEGKLTNYKYYPVIVYLTSKELEAYTLLSNEISRCLIKSKNGKMKLNKKGEILAIERARLIAAASEKIEVLKRIIQPYVNEKHILVYCGTASVLNETEDYSAIDEVELRQIDQVTKLLGNELNMKVSQFTSKENMQERIILKKEFETGENLQTLIAIKCLDEGVNIPKIKTAFILASTTNPKEYIQRRGRVLRLAEGKTYAEIYDLVTLPRPLNKVSSLASDELKRDLNLVKNEILRIKEFAKIAVNNIEAKVVIQQITDAYNLYSNNDIENTVF